MAKVGLALVGVAWQSSEAAKRMTSYETASKMMGRRDQPPLKRMFEAFSATRVKPVTTTSHC